MSDTIRFEAQTCPLPRSQHDHVQLGHGSGGKMTAELMRDVFLPAFANDILTPLEDQAILATGAPSQPLPKTAAGRIAFTTDAFVVKPLFFPGGNIGTLAVNGTINDLAVGGATPQFLSAAFILEEGFPIQKLQRIVTSMQEACTAANVKLVTGDTKVVDRGKGDELFIATSGIGIVEREQTLSIRHARPGDQVIVSGTIGDHGIAIMSVRENIEFETTLQSDSAALHELTAAMLDAAPNIRCMRDPTRGGVSSTLNELAASSSVGVELVESAIPVRREVHAACELLGLDPLYVANEGKLIAVVPAEETETLVAAMRRHPLGRRATVIGQVVAEHPGRVVMQSVIGGRRVVSMLAGEQLPRIC